VALSADGNTGLIGGSGDNEFDGAAWAFTRVNGSWSQQGDKLHGSDATAGAHQGFSVSLAGDGNTALLGAPSDSSFFGAVFAFIRSGNVWSQQGEKVTGAGEFGFSVSISADGSTAIGGAPLDSSFRGAAWLLTRNGDGWSTQKLTGTATIGGFLDGSRLGISVAISADGSTAITASPSDNKGNGAAWVFMRDCLVVGDANADGTLDVADVFFLINFLFANGPAPHPCS
jgi:hypothetical protein